MGIKSFLADRFSLHEDSAHENEIIDSITRNVEFKGSNLWSLIFAIFIASIGLNVNSTAVIIGAMLVSPLMGPIMGIGLGLGVNDIELIRKSLKNLLLATGISICVSTVYFFITPLHEAQSELLARTTPSIWDVFIAIFGGLAGIVGGTRKEKSNVIPGVAIATALMPPLCTAGYGLAVGNWYYFLGAFYLFFINSVFICISSFIVVRYLKLTKKTFSDDKHERKVNRLVISIVLLTAMPSIYLTYNIVKKSIFERNAMKFIKTEFKFKNSHIVNKVIKLENKTNEIELLLIGEDLSMGKIDTLRKKLSAYNLAGTKLIIRQGFSAKQQFDFSQVKESIFQEIVARQDDEPDPVYKSSANSDSNINSELKALYPEVISCVFSKAPITAGEKNGTDTILLFAGNVHGAFSKKHQSQLKEWLKIRLQSDSVILIIQKVGK